MSLHLVLFATLLFVAATSAFLTPELSANASVLLRSKVEQWRQYSASATRHSTADIIKSAGIYSRQSNTKYFGHNRLKRSTLMTVIQIGSEDMNRYIDIFINWMCFVDHYKFKVLVYVLPNDCDSSRYEEFKIRLSSLYDHIVVQPYPSELFWKILANKRVESDDDKFLLSSNSSCPSYQDFGALVTIVPILEVLEVGLDVIYFDIDIALIKDPIPYLMQGSADIIFSSELRTCTFPSRSVDPSVWHSIEANTGILYIKDSKPSRGFVKHWIQRIVDMSAKNDQIALDFGRATLLLNCNSQSSVIDQDLVIQDISHKHHDRAATHNARAVSYCFLNEFLFENGLVGFHCARGTKGGNKDDYMQGIAKMGSISRDTKKKKVYISPVTVHANYVNTKKSPLSARGLWLANEDAASLLNSKSPISTKSVCKPYDFLATHYADVSWERMFQDSAKAYTQSLRTLSDGEVLTFEHDLSNTVYIFHHGRLQRISDPDNLPTIGFDKKHIRLIADRVLQAIPRSPDITAASIQSIVKYVETPKDEGKSEGKTVVKPRKKLTRIEENSLHWLGLSKKAHDEKRDALVSATLKRASGIYKTPTILSLGEASQSVLVNVIAYESDSERTSRYLEMLVNWFCFAEHHQLKPITYLITSTNMTFNEQVNSLRRLGIQSDFLPYPEELFWKLIAQKSTDLLQGPHRVDYASTRPSFQHFGALVMLVPLLEVIELGYDAVYLDLDIAFVGDPIPHIMHGKSDIKVSIEMRTCIFPSTYDNMNFTEWRYLEPNTGIMYLRSSDAGKSITRKWLSYIINENINNDQKVLYFEMFGASLSFDCNPHLMPYADNLWKSYNNSLSPEQHEKLQTTEPKGNYCYLNEMLFQNGKVALGCSVGRGGSMSEYVLGMEEQSIAYPESINSVTETEKMTPIAVHMNYCDDKINEFKGLGLWLPNITTHADGSANGKCMAFDSKETKYFKTNWKNAIVTAHKDIDQARDKFKNNSIVKLHKNPNFYLVVNGELRRFPDGDTLERMGYSFKQVNYMKQFNFIKFFPRGEDLPSIPDPPPTAASPKMRRLRYV